MLETKVSEKATSARFFLKLSNNKMVYANGNELKTVKRQAEEVIIIDKTKM